MIERERRGVERLTAQHARDLGEPFVARLVAVDRIADERPAVIGRVHADLMRAPGLEPEPHDGRIVQRLDELPVRHRGLARRDLRRELLAVHRMAAVHRAQRAARGGRRRRRDREILPRDAAGLAAALRGKRGRERGVCAVGLGRDHHAARVLVEPVHDARSQHAADAREVLAVKQQRVDERAGRMAGRGMDDQPGGFIDHDQLAILVEHRERDRLGDQLERLRGRNGDLDRIAEPHARPGFHRNDAIDGDVTVFDQALDLRPRQLGDRTRDHGIEPPTDQLFIDLDATNVAVVIEIVAHQIFDLT